MKLSILIPTVSERRSSFLPKSMEMVYGQLEKLGTKEVEVLYLADNKTMMLGDKRNLMIDMAKGEYISYFGILLMIFKLMTL